MAADKEDGGGTDKFEKLNARLDGLAKAADGYKGSEVEDLAEGLADDVADLKKRVGKAKGDSDKKKNMGMVTAAGAAAIVAVLAFIFGPRRAGAMEETALLAFSSNSMKETSLVYDASPAETSAGAAEAEQSFIAADQFVGAKEGFVFKTGAQGLGYYADTGELAAEFAAVKKGQGGFLNLQISTPAAIGLGVAGVTIPLVGRKLWPMIKMARMLAAMNKAAQANSAAGSPPGGFGGFSGVPPFTPPPYAATAPPTADTFKSAAPVSEEAVASASAGASAAEPDAPSPSSKEKAPAAVDTSRDAAMMKAGELKAGILALGGNPSGLVEKAELVAMYRELQSQPRSVETKKYTPDSNTKATAANDASPADQLRGMTMDPSMMGGPGPDFANMDPSMMSNMMGNPMIQALSNQMMNDPETMKEFQEAMSSGKGPDELMKSPKMMQLTEKLMSDPAILQMMSDPSKVNKMMEDMQKMGIKPPY